MRRASVGKQYAYGALTLIAVGALSMYLFKTSQVAPGSEEYFSATTSAVATSTNPIAPKTHSEPKYEIVEPIELKSRARLKDEPVYVNPVTHDVVTYEQSPVQSRNPVESVLLNGKRIGDYAGYRLTDLRVSPTGQYVSFESMWVCGSGCTEYHVYLIDFKSGKFWSVRPPIARAGSDTNLYIESSSWIGEGDTMEITGYMTDIVEVSGTSNRMRVSHKQVWQYDLATRKFTLVRELQEE